MDVNEDCARYVCVSACDFYVHASQEALLSKGNREDKVKDPCHFLLD